MNSPDHKNVAEANAEPENLPQVLEILQKKTFSDYLTAYGTAVAALGAGAAAVVSYMQVRYTQEQIRIAINTEEVQLRSYINTEMVGVKEKDPDKIFEVDFSAINRGLTPANHVMITSSIHLKSDPGFKSDIGFKNRVLARGIFLGSSQSYPMYFGITLYPDQHEATTKEAAKFLNEHGAMIFSGEITYTDVFDHKHIDGFCFEGFQDGNYIDVVPCEN